MQQLCFECYRRLPSSDGVVEGDQHQCVCGKQYRMGRTTVHIGEPQVVDHQLVHKFVAVLFWYLVDDQDNTDNKDVE